MIMLIVEKRVELKKKGKKKLFWTGPIASTSAGTDGFFTEPSKWNHLLKKKNSRQKFFNRTEEWRKIELKISNFFHWI